MHVIQYLCHGGLIMIACLHINYSMDWLPLIYSLLQGAYVKDSMIESVPSVCHSNFWHSSHSFSLVPPGLAAHTC